MTTYDATEILTTMRRLTYHEHEAARTEAALRTAGTKPENDDFTSESVSEYPQWMFWLVLFFVVIAAGAALFPTAIRISDQGYKVASETVSEADAKTISRSMVVLADAGITLFLLAAAILPSGRGVHSILYSLAAVAAMVALSGNVAASQPFNARNMQSVFAWSEALAPTIIYGGLSFVVKELLLMRVRTNRAANLAYETALAAYENTLTNAEQAPGYERNWHGALRDALEFANSHGPGSGKRKRVMPGMLPADWARLVAKELNAGNELTSEIERASKRPERKAKAPAKVSAESEAGEHVAKCPTCEWVSERTYKTSAKAARAYNGHCGGAGHIANLEALQPVAHTNGSGAES